MASRPQAMRRQDRRREGELRGDRQRLGVFASSDDGVRDQIAAMAGRLPMEVGHIYDEDKHLLDVALQSLDRLFKKWEG